MGVRRVAALGASTALLQALGLLAGPHAVAAEAAAPPGDAGLGDDPIAIVHQGERSADPAGWHQWRACRGSYRLAMTYQDFYRLTGRPDLAEQDGSRRRISAVMTVVGFAALLAGVVVSPWRYAEHDRVGAVLGLAMAGAGYATLKVGEHLSRPVISEAEADELARSFNRTLGQNAAGGRGLGVMLSGTFH